MCRLNPSFRIAGAPNGAIHRGPASVDQGAGRGGGLALGNEAVSARGVRRGRRQPPAGPEKRPDDALGMEQVCRVLKAADGSTRRANAFIAHLNGTGENPLPAFTKEME